MAVVQLRLRIYSALTDVLIQRRSGWMTLPQETAVHLLFPTAKCHISNCELRQFKKNVTVIAP